MISFILMIYFLLKNYHKARSQPGQKGNSNKMVFDRIKKWFMSVFSNMRYHSLENKYGNHDVLNRQKKKDYSESRNKRKELLYRPTQLSQIRYDTMTTPRRTFNSSKTDGKIIQKLDLNLWDNTLGRVMLVWKRVSGLINLLLNRLEINLKHRLMQLKDHSCQSTNKALRGVCSVKVQVILVV